MRPPSLDQILHQPLLGPLAVVEIALVVLTRTLRGSYPDVDRAPYPGDGPATLAARRLVDNCDLLMRSLDYFRDQLYHLRYNQRPEPDCPF